MKASGSHQLESMDRIQNDALGQKLTLTPAQRERYKALEIVEKVGK